MANYIIEFQFVADQNPEDDLAEEMRQQLRDIFTMTAFQYDCDFDLAELSETDELHISFVNRSDAEEFYEDITRTDLYGMEGLVISRPKPLA